MHRHAADAQLLSDGRRPQALIPQLADPLGRNGGRTSLARVHAWSLCLGDALRLPRTAQVGLELSELGLPRIGYCWRGLLSCYTAALWR